MRDNRAIHGRIRECACKDTDALFRELGLSAQGCTGQEAEERRTRYGSNRLAGRASDTVLYRLRRAFINPFSIVLFVLALISFVTDVLLASNFSRDMTTVVIILAMLLISGVVRLVQELRAKRVADRLTGMIAANDLFVSQSVITGESAILEKNAAPLAPDRAQTYGTYSNIVFMGSAVIGGAGQGVVLAVGQDTVYGGFGAADARPKDGFDRGANSIAWVLIRFMSVLVPIVFIACGLTRGNWLSAFLFALSVAVGLTPEMLPMVINACLARGSAAMGKKQTVVKSINAMQGFGSMDILCVDKTGTLTGDTLLLEYYMDILGNESRRVLDLAYLNSLYHTGVRNHLDAPFCNAGRCRGTSPGWRNWPPGTPSWTNCPLTMSASWPACWCRRKARRC